MPDLTRIFNGPYDYMAISDYCVLYVPLIGTNSNLRVVTRCNKFGTLINMTEKDFENIRESLENIG